MRLVATYLKDLHVAQHINSGDFTKGATKKWKAECINACWALLKEDLDISNSIPCYDVSHSTLDGVSF